jgi:membrane protein required for beta-lactamase induction
MARPAETDRPPSLGWVVLAAVVVIGAVWLLLSAVVGLLVGLFKIVVLTAIAIAVLTWAINQKVDRGGRGGRNAGGGRPG